MLVSHSQESDTRVGGDTARAIKTLLGMGPQALILKVGGEGAQVHLKTGRMVPVPGFPVKVQNILGAGDAFASTFTAALMHGADVPSALLWAPINSMNVVQHVGAQAGLLTDDEIDYFLRNAPDWYHPEKF